MVEDWKEAIGERLLALRMQKGMTQEELAEYLKVSRQSVSKWELNKTLPDVDKMVQLADLYGVSMDHLVRGLESEPAEAGAEQEEAETSVIEKEEEQVAVSEKIQTTSTDLTIHRMLFLLAMAVSGIVCLLCIGFSVMMIRRNVISLKGKQQDTASVDRIVEQYTLADVTIWDEDTNYHTKRVWLDTKGVKEGDYVSYLYEDAHTASPRFQYDSKTILFPMFISILFLIFTIIFWVGFHNYKEKQE